MLKKRLMLTAVAGLVLATSADLVWRLIEPPNTAQCSECGSGPKDRKCPDGYHCSDGRCVKN